MKKLFAVYLCFIANWAYGQNIKVRLAQSVREMEADPQLRHAIIAISIVESKTGNSVYEHHSQTGLAPASTQKLFTSCAAFDLLGKDYRYTTDILYRHQKGNTGTGFLQITPSGDPSFGSSRFTSTKPGTLFTQIVTALRREKIDPFSPVVKVDSIFDDHIPGGWIWDDIGNYYGAGAFGFNWMENQYDIILKSGKKIGDTVVIAAINPPEITEIFSANLHTAEKNSGDNTIVYLPYGTGSPAITGTIPVNENAFEVSASIAHPSLAFSKQLDKRIKDEGIGITYAYNRHTDSFVNERNMLRIPLYKHLSPPLDSLNYWFLKKSINLYGEALIKTMAYQQSGIGSTEKGVALLKDFWSKKGIEKSALNICDGSGLSPQNRVTAAALVTVLQYARTRPWFSSLYYALPEYNGMKMKSGSISGARAYAGYHTARDGREYSFAIIVNNYDGPAANTVKKIFGVLDILK